MPIIGDFDKLWNSYPKGFTKDHSPGVDQAAEEKRIAKLGEELKKSIGGKVISPNYINLCVIRLSFSMNRCGLMIPEKTPLKWYGQDLYEVAKGGDGFFYGLGVTETYHYFLENHGNPDQDLSRPFQFTPDGKRVPVVLKGKRGILVFLISGWNDATGHVTLWDGSKCSDNDYFDLADKVYFWEVIKVAPKPIRITNLNDSIRIKAVPIPADSGQ